ncbi:hypothetical protein [Bacteroides salyersiae]|uniref:hypothetical protein n=1 Tax=Bacteroides salyersiae TaxID=291644 RepID=UPI002165B8B2|nr:hypothetical protein [Bacteroides salyersiae]MCS3057455.1 hypothetical protein [Bacteroides salyersiae]
MERESFFEDVEWLSRLSLRGSVGTSGNNTSGIMPHKVYMVTVATTVLRLLTRKRLPNPELSWEKSTQSSVGLDVAYFLICRLNITRLRPL